MTTTTANPSPHAQAHLCPPWLGALLDNPIRAVFQNPAALLRRRVTAGQRAADIGCGPGFFTFPLCDLVGSNGRVFAIDIQPEMLQRIEHKAEQRRTTNLLTTLYRPGKFVLPEKLDFVLMFWMLHEVSDAARLVSEIREWLQPTGTILFVEPKIHVRSAKYHAELDLFTAAGFRVREPVSVRFSRAALLEQT